MGIQVVRGLVVPGRLLDIAEISSNFSKPSSGAGVEDITGQVVDFTIGNNPNVWVEWYCALASHATSGATTTIIVRDSANNQLASSGAHLCRTAGDTIKPHIRALITGLTAGVYQYKGSINTSSGTPTITASAVAKCYLAVFEALLA